MGAGSDRGDDEYVPPKRFGGIRFRLRAGVPRSTVGRLIAGGVVLAGLLSFTAGLWEARTMLLHNPRLVIPSSSAIQITGNQHLTRAQLVGVFGGDVDRNILTVPLAERRADLERLPWVEHATVMRLMPNRFRVAIVERKPVAFVRQGSTIGLVDGTGVLLDMSSDGETSDAANAKTKYSFPVVSGIAASDPLSTRTARMKLFTRFTSDLDAGPDKVSKKLSEVDLSSPEDVKALIAEGRSDILVHFGDDNFLHRYELFEQHLPGWKKDFPHLASADMRYERQVVLEMQPGASVPVAADASATAAAAASPTVIKPVPARPGKSPAKSGTKTPAKPVKKAVPLARAAATTPGHLQTAFDVRAKSSVAGAKSHTPQAGPR